MKKFIFLFLCFSILFIGETKSQYMNLTGCFISMSGNLVEISPCIYHCDPYPSNDFRCQFQCSSFCGLVVQASWNPNFEWWEIYIYDSGSLVSHVHGLNPVVTNVTVTYEGEEVVIQEFSWEDTGG